MGNNLAAVLVKQGCDLRLVEVNDPALKESQVRVRIIKTAICGTQIGEWSGTRGVDKYLPHCLGHEAVGEVLEVGSQVKSVKPGDLVVVSWIKSMKLLPGKSPAYINLQNGEVVNSGECATFIRRGVFPENRVTKIMSGKVLDHYPLLGCALLTACGVIRNVYKEQILFGESGVVVGLGGIGLATALILNSLGYRISGVDKKHNVDKYKQLGLPFPLFTLDDVELQDQRFSVLTAGSIDAIESGIRLLSITKGIAFLVANPPANQYISLNSKELLYGKKIVGIGEKDSDPAEDIERMKVYLDEHPEIAKFLVRGEYSFEFINEAIKDAAENGGARIVINFGEN